PRSRSRWSASMVRRTRKITMTMARPTATSATVMAMVNSVKISPARSPRKREKATRLTFTALSISSMPSRMPTAFLRVSTPKSPMANTSAARMRYAWSGILSPPSVRSRARRGARSPAARRGVGAVPRRARPGDGARLQQEAEEADEHGGRQHGAVEDEAARLSDGLADQPLGEHDREDGDGHDTTRVEQQLDGEEERRVEQQEHAAGGHQG